MYIEREALINRLLAVAVTDDTFGMGIQCGTNHAIEVVKEAPAADVAPVVHGEWKFEHDPINDPKKYFIRIVCSCCGLKTGQKSNYCPNCGAKMDGGT